MHGAAFSGFFDSFLPRFTLKHFAGTDRFGNEFRALGEHASRPHGIVSDLGIAHIGIGGQTDRGSMRFQLCAGKRFHELVKKRRGGIKNGIAFFVFAEANPVHDRKDNRSFSSLKFRIAF